MKLSFYASRYIDGDKHIKVNNDWRYKLIEDNLDLNSNVLDIGCSSGSFKDVWNHKNINYFGLDYNDELVSYCKNKGLDVRQYDASKDSIPFESETFDFIYCSHVFEHLLSNEQIFLFSEMSRVLKKGGKLVLFTPTPYSWYFWDDPTHQRPSTHGSLEHLSKDFGLDVIECKYSNLRFFGEIYQKWLRLPPIRWFLWEVYLVASKK